MTWPFENDTGATVKKLAKRSLKAGKNTIAILSIVLAAVMFTSVFTIALCHSASDRHCPGALAVLSKNGQGLYCGAVAIDRVSLTTR